MDLILLLGCLPGGHARGCVRCLSEHPAVQHALLMTLACRTLAAVNSPAVCAATLDDQRATKQAVFQAMLEVPWVAGEGIPDSPADNTQYAELLAAGRCLLSLSCALSSSWRLPPCYRQRRAACLAISIWLAGRRNSLCALYCLPWWLAGCGSVCGAVCRV
jgi:hypothetical protein